MKVEALGIDTDCAAAQKAKRLGIAVHDAIALAVRDKRIKANAQAMHAAQHEKHDYRCITGWQYHKPASANHDPHWTYHPEEGVEVRIYDQEDQS